MKIVIFSFLFAAVIFVCAFGDVETDSEAQKCPANSKWNVCGTACPTTCKQQTPPPCTKQCNPSCQCEKNRVWEDDSHSKCVQISECNSATSSAPRF